MNIPTLNDVFAFAQEQHATAELARKFYNYNCARRWEVRGTPIDDWQRLFQTWMSYENVAPPPIMPESRTKASAQQLQPQPTRLEKMQQRVETEWEKQQRWYRESRTPEALNAKRLFFEHHPEFGPWHPTDEEIRIMQQGHFLPVPYPPVVNENANVNANVQESSVLPSSNDPVGKNDVPDVRRLLFEQRQQILNFPE